MTTAKDKSTESSVLDLCYPPRGLHVTCWNLFSFVRQTVCHFILRIIYQNCLARATEKSFSHLKQWTASPNIIHSWKTFSEFPVLTETVWTDFLVDCCMNKNASLRDIETQGWLYDCGAALIWRSMESKGVQRTESILHNNKIQHLKDRSIPQMTQTHCWLKIRWDIACRFWYLMNTNQIPPHKLQRDSSCYANLHVVKCHTLIWAHKINVTNLFWN